MTETMLKHDWIVEVLCDLEHYCLANGLELTGEFLADAKISVMLDTISDHDRAAVNNLAQDKLSAARDRKIRHDCNILNFRFVARE